MMERDPLVSRIEAELAQAGIYVDVGITAAGVLLSGAVASVRDRALAEELAGHVAAGRPIENNLDVEPAGVSTANEYEYVEEPFIRESLLVVGESEDDGGASPYFPATDPVLEAGEVIGGFEATSMDSLEVESSTFNGVLGDEALAEAVRRELREDAATTDLPIDVSVEKGVVRLRGSVLSLDDIENAEEVAGRLPGVREVVEELELVGKA